MRLASPGGVDSSPRPPSTLPDSSGILGVYLWGFRVVLEGRFVCMDIGEGRTLAGCEDYASRLGPLDTTSRCRIILRTHKRGQ